MTNHFSKPLKVKFDKLFYLGIGSLGGFYILMIILLVVALVLKVSMDDVLRILRNPKTHYSIKLSFISCTVSALLCLWVAVPIGYIMSRFEFPLKNLIDAILDIPIVLPPLVIGLALLILFNLPFGTMDMDYKKLDGTTMTVKEDRTIERMVEAQGRTFNKRWRITNGVPGVILAQFMVACAFAARSMRATFDQISPRQEQVAMTLGSSRGQAFWSVVLPQTYKGMMTAGTLAWARSLGEFGPILIFCGIIPLRTEVLSSSVYLLFSVGDLAGAAVVSLFMILLALVVLVAVRMMGNKRVEL